jgi:hypothetical protein
MVIFQLQGNWARSDWLAYALLGFEQAAARDRSRRWQ